MPILKWYLYKCRPAEVSQANCNLNNVSFHSPSSMLLALATVFSCCYNFNVYISVPVCFFPYFTIYHCILVHSFAWWMWDLPLHISNRFQSFWLLLSFHLKYALLCASLYFPNTELWPFLWYLFLLPKPTLSISHLYIWGQFSDIHVDSALGHIAKRAVSSFINNVTFWSC